MTLLEQMREVQAFWDAYPFDPENPPTFAELMAVILERCRGQE